LGNGLSELEKPSVGPKVADVGKEAPIKKEGVEIGNMGEDQWARRARTLFRKLKNKKMEHRKRLEKKKSIGEEK